MTLSRRHFSTGLTAGIALPALFDRANAQGATIKIGMCAPVTGPAAESGRYAQIGAKIQGDKANLRANHHLEGAKMGVDVAKHHATLAHQASQKQPSKGEE